jgi:DNA-nicking Smr family endonuclease
MGIKKEVVEPLLFQPFGDLKKIIASKGLKISPESPVIKKEVPITDEELFANAMKEVREIREFRRIPARRHKASSGPVKSSGADDTLVILKEIVNGRRAVNLSDTQEYVEWINQDFRNFNLKRLHEGRFSVQDYLDLHGLNVEEAENAVGSFLRDCMIKGYRCIKIIHGRGLRSPNGPVLKTALVKWLSGRYRKKIIAFSSARQCDGGLGALYVLLR